MTRAAKFCTNTYCSDHRVGHCSGQGSYIGTIGILNSHRIVARVQCEKMANVVLLVNVGDWWVTFLTSVQLGVKLTEK